MIERKQGRRSAQDAVKTKGEILRVAANMFCELGYERVSLRSISEQAGVSHSLIRHHFGSKEKIWYAISDGLQEYMVNYIQTIIENMPKNIPANEKMYIFAVRLLAQMLTNKRPIQLIADAVRQEDALFDYFVDQSGKIQTAVDDIADEYNREHPHTPIKVWEIKWQMIMYAHGAASLLPFLEQTWSDETKDVDQCLLNHWQMFNQIMIQRLQINSEQILSPKQLSELVYETDCE